MEIQGVSGSRLLPLVRTDPKPKTAAQSFGEILSQAVSQLERLQQEADLSIESLAAGEDIDIHEVMIAVEKASLALELTLQVRNKLVESYQEIMRMQI